MAAEYFSIGEQFSSFEEFQVKLERFKASNFIEVYRRDSRSIVAAERRINKSLNRKLKFYQLKYTCVHGGKNFKTRSNGQRRSSTLKQNCPFSLSLRASEDGQKLEVKMIIENHNHEINRELFRHLPSQRKLSAEEKKKVKRLLDTGVDRKSLQKQIMAETNKIVLLKDLTNLAQEAKSGGTRNDTRQFCNALETESENIPINKRFRTAKLLTDNIAQVCSELTGDAFRSRVADLQKLLDCWSSGLDISISMVESDATSEAIGSCVSPTESSFNADEYSYVQPKCTVQSKQDPKNSIYQDISNLKMPPIVKTPGRPRGIDLTVEGLPAKKKSKGSLIPFCKLHVSSKISKVLSWLVPHPTATMALKGTYLLEPVDVNKNISKLHTGIVDDLVDINIVRPYFTNGAWKIVCQMKEKKIKRPNWKCCRCSHSLGGETICCDGCLQWQHLECALLNARPKVQYWFCQVCHDGSRKETIVPIAEVNLNGLGF